MAVQTNNFDTGPATLADLGTLSYNACRFSPLFETTVSGTAVKDNAQRTVKYMDYLITVDGYVTLPDGATSINSTMNTLRLLLTAQGGSLVYQGRGCDIIVNSAAVGAGGAIGKTVIRDVAWGPIPELLEFQPLGGGLSAKVRWQVKTRIPEQIPDAAKSNSLSAQTRILQFNYETVVSYDDSGYSSMSIRGTLEVPYTRTKQIDRTLTSTVDDVRDIINERLLAGVDLNLFTVTKRDFSVSRDKRTMEFDFEVQEKPYMDLPPGSTVAHGSYSVRPSKAGVGLCKWMCTLRATYTVRADFPRRWAWFAFLYLLRLRMSYSNLAAAPEGGQNPPPKAKKIPLTPLSGFLKGVFGPWKELLKKQEKPVKDSRRAWLMDFSIEEGLYRDSQTTTFSATWMLISTFSHILLASGVWRKLPETNAQGSNLWAIYMRDIQGSKSWMPNKLDPRLDVIVDFGGG